MSSSNSVTQEQPKALSSYIQLSYAGADTTFAMMVALTNTFVLIFLTNVALFPAAIAGSILFFGRILDGISAPPIGALIERSNMKWGKYRPWLVIGSVLTLIFNILIFIDWNGSAGAVVFKAIICCLVYAAFCASTNLVYTGFTSLNSSLTSVPVERVKLSSLRSQGGAIGRILSGYLLIPMIHFFGGIGEYTVKGFFVTAVVTSIILVFGYLNLAFAIKDKDTYTPEAEIKEVVQPQLLTRSEAFRFIITNRPLMCLFFSDVVRLLSFLVTLAMFPFFFLYVSQDPGAAPMLFGSTAIATLVGATLTRFVTKVISKRNTYMLGMIIFGASFVVANAFKFDTPIMVGALVIGFVGYAFASTVTTAIYADIVDYGEVKYGKNARANYFAMFQLSIKVAAILSTGISGFGLAAIGFVAGTEPTAQVIAGINFIALALPIGLSVLTIISMLLFNLTDKKMLEVREILESKKVGLDAQL